MPVLNLKNIMRIIVLLAASLLAGAPAHAQLVKTIYQTFEVPDSTTTVFFEIYENDSLEVVPWAGNTIMTESNVKMYYVSRGVFDYLLEQGRYNFEAVEDGEKLALSSVKERRLQVKLGNGEPQGPESEKKSYEYEKGKENEKVTIRIFIPDEFTRSSPVSWSRPREERSEERIGAYRPRKKLNREAGDVADELREAIPEIPKDTVEEKILLPMPDSTWRRQPGLQEKTKNQK